MVPNLKSSRLIGRHTGAQRGPLLICFGALHGNEPAGVRALETLFKMLQDEPTKNPTFQFKGRIVGFIGNLQAYQNNVRYIQKDLNRQFHGVWRADSITDLTKVQDEAEKVELHELLQAVHTEIADYQPDHLYILDLHTTSADGGIFSIPSTDQESLTMATDLHAPVVKGLMNGVTGTTLHYFNTQNMGVPTVAVTFEGGQHNDPQSIQRCIAVIVNCLRAIGSVRPTDVESKHDDILKAYATGLPKVVELIHCHHIQPNDHFQMRPNYQNFQKVKKGEILATDKNGNILASQSAMILMPLYQPKGEDGFFLVE